MGRVERRKRETWLQFLWVLGDALAVFAAFPLAHALRFHSPVTDVLPLTKSVPPIGPYVTAGAILTAVTLPFLAAAGMYRLEQIGSRTQKALRLARAALGAVLVGAAFSFFYREFTFSRSYFPVLYVMLVGLLVLERAAIGALSRRWRRRHPLRVLLAGDTPIGHEVVRRLLDVDPTGFRLVGCLNAGGVAPAGGGRAGGSGPAPEPARGPSLFDPAQEPAIAVATAVAGASEPIGDEALEVLGRYADAASIVASRGVDVLVLALPLAEQRAAVDIVRSCRGLPVDIELVPDTLQLLSRRARVRELDGLPILSLREIPLTGWAWVQKRSFDLVASGLALALLSPLLAMIAVAVKRSSPGPVLYRQERIGRDGRRFAILKFRSMPVNAEAATGPVWARRDDGRPTRVGAFLRKWSLDELPQLVNVVRGEMSLVGPRPERPHFVDRFSGEMPDYVDRHRVKSGITGWAQVNGLRGDTSIAERTRFDLHYVENWSLMLDLKILVRTLLVVLRRDQAY